MIVSGDQWRDSAIHKHVSILPQTYLLCFRLDEHAVFALAGGFFTTSTTWEALLWELEKQAQRGCAVCPRSHRSGLLNWTLRYLRLALLFALSLPYLFAGFLIWLQYAACRILAPRTGIKPSPQQWNCQVLTTGLPGNPGTSSLPSLVKTLTLNAN